MNETFDNPSIPKDQLPGILEEDYKQLESKYKILLHIRNGLFHFALLAILIAIYFIKQEDELPNYYLLSLIPILLLWTYAILIVQLGFSHKGYILRKHDIIFKTGYLNRKTTAIPKNRIQHVEIRQSILSRIFKLSKLIVFTAGGNSSDLSIPGLNPEDAQQLKEHISKSISQYE